MNIFLMLAILLANIIAIAIVYALIRSLGKKEKLIFIAMSVALVYISISITYWISGFGIDSNINQQAKSFVTYMFVPVNMVLFVPYIAVNYIKMKQKKLKKEKFIKKCMVLSLIILIVLIIECFYFKNIQNNIGKIKDDNETKTTQTQNVQENLITTNNTKY